MSEKTLPNAYKEIRYAKAENVGDVPTINAVNSKDTRTMNSNPSDYAMGLRPEFKISNTIGIGISKFGTYSGLLTFRPYGSRDDFSGGNVQQIAFPTNNTSGLMRRYGNDNNSWNNWKEIWDSGNFDPNSKVSKTDSVVIDRGSISGTSVNLNTLTTAGVYKTTNMENNFSPDFSVVYGQGILIIEKSDTAILQRYIANDVNNFTICRVSYDNGVSWRKWIKQNNSTSIVNDLTTGGADKVLSAEMGKGLNLSKVDKSNSTQGDGTILYNCKSKEYYFQQGWYKIAEVEVLQSTSNAIIEITGGTGYNDKAIHRQAQAKIIIRGGNNTPKGIAVSCMITGDTNYITKVSYYNLRDNIYEIFVYFGSVHTTMAIMTGYNYDRFMKFFNEYREEIASAPSNHTETIRVFSDINYNPSKIYYKIIGKGVNYDTIKDAGWYQCVGGYQNPDMNAPYPDTFLMQVWKYSTWTYQRAVSYYNAGYSYIRCFEDGVNNVPWEIEFNSKNCPIQKSAHGYQKLPSGLIVQWGGIGTGVKTVNFPISFLNGYRLYITASHKNGSNAELLEWAYLSYVDEDLEKFNLVKTTSRMYRQWVAIGY